MHKFSSALFLMASVSDWTQSEFDSVSDDELEDLEVSLCSKLHVNYFVSTTFRMLIDASNCT